MYSSTEYFHKKVLFTSTHKKYSSTVLEYKYSSTFPTLWVERSPGFPLEPLVAEAVGNNHVVYGVLQIRRTRIYFYKNIYIYMYIGKDHTLKNMYVEVRQRGGNGKIPFLLKTT